MGCVLRWGCDVVKNGAALPLPSRVAASDVGATRGTRDAATRATACRAFFCEAAGFLCDRRWVAKAQLLHLFSQKMCLSGAACSTAEWQRRHSFCIFFRKNCAGAERLFDRRWAATARILHFLSQNPCRSGTIVCGDILRSVDTFCGDILCSIYTVNQGDFGCVVIVGVFFGLAGVLLVFSSVF